MSSGMCFLRGLLTTTDVAAPCCLLSACCRSESSPDSGYSSKNPYSGDFFIAGTLGAESGGDMGA